MRKIGIFNFITLNGFFRGADGDTSWHRHGEEESKFAEQNLQADNILLFGRITYEMMAWYWQSPDAIKNSPVVAERMNKAEKIVFSKTLQKAEWNNSTLISGNIIEEIKKLKQAPGKDIAVLGSGSIVTQFAEHGLIDEYQVMIDPVILGDGTPIFKNVSHKIDLELTSTRTFKSGVVLLCYKPLK